MLKANYWPMRNSSLHLIDRPSPSPSTGKLTRSIFSKYLRIVGGMNIGGAVFRDLVQSEKRVSFTVLTLVLVSFLIFTMKTVNHRILGDEIPPATYLETDPNGKVRWNRSLPLSYAPINAWLKDGFFHDLGLSFQFPTTSASGSQTVHSHSEPGYILPLFLMEKGVTWVKGEQSVWLHRFYPMLIVFLGALFLSLFSREVLLRHGMGPRQTICLASCVGLLYQSFPYNLAHTRDLVANVVTNSLTCLLLYLEERSRAKSAHDFKFQASVDRLRWLIMFWIGYTDFVLGFILILSFIVLGFAGFSEEDKPLSVFKKYAWPYFISVAIWHLQLFLGQSRFPMAVYGSSFLFRTGLDGSKALYLSHGDIFSSPYRWHTWVGTAGFSILAYLAVILGRVFSKSGKSWDIDLRYLFILTGTALILFTAFSQAAFIHPYNYDIYFYMPACLVLGLYLPVLLEKLTAHSNLFVLGTFLFTWAQVWVNMRSYVAYYGP